jgi:hypothetical protein
MEKLLTFLAKLGLGDPKTSPARLKIIENAKYIPLADTNTGKLLASSCSEI